MAYMQYLVFDGENLPLPDSYELNMDDMEADSGGETEAGTIQRDVVRAGVVSVAVSFSVTAKWLQKLTDYKLKEKINVRYFVLKSTEWTESEMYIEGFKARLAKDTSYKGLWTVGFTLKEF